MKTIIENLFIAAAFFLSFMGILWFIFCYKK